MVGNVSVLSFFNIHYDCLLSEKEYLCTQILTITNKMKLTHRLIAIVAMLFTVLVASAKDYILKEGDNVVDGYTSADCKFIAPKDCKVLIEAMEVFNVVYDGKQITNKYAPGSPLSFNWEIDGVKEGTEISVTQGFVMNTKSTIRVTCYEASSVIPVTLQRVYPLEKKEFGWYTDGMVSLIFSKTVLFNSIKLVAGDYSADVDDIHTGTGLGFSITNALNGGLKNGHIQPGDKFFIEIEGLCDAADRSNLFNGDGKLTLEYIAPHPQHDMVSATVGGEQISYLQANTYTFLSFYPKDSEDGLFVFEFDDAISNVNDVSLTMGNLDLDASGKFHRSTLPYTIEGNKLLVDARGTLRTLALLFPAIVEEDPGDNEVNEGIGSYDTEHVTITISNVLDSNGNAFRSLAQGSVGSFGYVFNYKEIFDPVSMDGDNCSEGDEVGAGQEISLWVSNSGVKFDGIEVTYFVKEANPLDDADEILVQRSVSIPASEITTEPDPFEGFVITFALPAMPDVAPGTTIRVLLKDASTSDGMPHYMYIEFKALGAIVGGGISNAISNVATQSLTGETYTVSGLKVAPSQMRRGNVYILNGKKILK